MQYDTIPSNGNISHTLTIAQGGDIRTIYQVGAEGLHPRLAGYTGYVGVNGYLKNLKARSEVSNLAELQLPVFALDEDDSVKLSKTLDLQWKTARYEMDIWLAKPGKPWEPLGQISLQNAGGYPYRIHNLLDVFTDELAFELAQGAKIGVSIRDVGWGTLQGSDTVTLYGSWQEEILFVNDTIQQQEEMMRERVTEEVESNRFLTSQHLISQNITVWDASKGHFATLNPTQALTLTANNLKEGTYILMLPPSPNKNTINFDSQIFVFADPINLDANNLDIVSFASDGTKLYGIPKGGFSS